MTQFIHQPHDKLFKQSMADVRVARDFFESHLPSELLQRIDLNTLKLQKQTFVDEAYKTTEADVVYTVKIEDTLAYLYILCEHQSEVDEAIAFRLLVYTVRIMEMHLQQNPKSFLPLVYPLVVYSGEKSWNAPLELFELFGKQKALAKQFLFQAYQLLEIQRLKDDELKQHLWSGLVEFILKYRRVRDFERYLETLLPWLERVEIESGTNYVKVVLEYVLTSLEAEDEELFIEKSDQYLSEKLRREVMTLAQRFEARGMEQGMQRGIQQGMQQGLQQGMKQGESSLLLRLLERKFKTVPEEHRQKLAKADTETLLAWGERVLSVDTLDEVFE